MRRNCGFVKGMIVLCVILAGALLFVNSGYQKIKEKTVGSILKDELVSKASEYSGLTKDQIKSILDVIPEDQQKEIVQIISDHVNPSSISEIADFIKNKDTDGMESFAENELSDAEKQDIESIIDDNQSGISEKLSEYGISNDLMKELLPQWNQ